MFKTNGFKKQRQSDFLEMGARDPIDEDINKIEEDIN